MLFAPAQVGPHSRCQKVLVMSTCPPVSANHADGCAHGQLIIFSAPVAHVAFTSNWGEAAVHLPCPAAWSPAQLGPHARPSTPLHTCTDLLSRGRHHLPGLQWGGVPRTVGKGSSAFCPRLPGLCEGPEACLLPSLCQLHSSATHPQPPSPRAASRALWTCHDPVPGSCGGHGLLGGPHVTVGPLK